MIDATNRSDVILVVVDVQEKMMRAIHNGDEVVDKVSRLVRGCRTLGLPILVTEQYPNGLGPTVQEVRDALEDDYRPLEKMSFSAARDIDFMRAFEASGKEHILLCGVETHVCVYQTARDLHNLGWTVEIVADAVGSRTQQNRDTALKRLKQHGVDLTSVEMTLFDMMETAEFPDFKTISGIIK